MELDKRTLIISTGFGLGVWVVDAAVDAIFFYEGGFLSLLLFDVPLHEVYVRLATLVAFILFGMVLSQQAARLRHRERDLSLFRSLIDNANDGIYVLDPQTTEFIDVNKTAGEMLGYSRDEYLEMDITDIKDQFADPEDFREFIQSPDGKELEAYETTHITKDGTRLPVEISASHVELDGVDYRVAIARDISQRQELEHELETEHIRHELLFDSIRDAILVADSDRCVINCNPAFTDLFGYELDEIGGKPTEYIYASGQDFEEMGDEIAAHIEDSSYTHTIPYETKTGRIFPGETNVSYLRDPEGEILGFIGLIRDVSSREERIKQMEVIDHVLRHNLRNDMNVIQGRAEIIKSEAADSVAEYADKILSVSDQLLDTVTKEREITTLLSKDWRTVTIDIGETVVLTVEDIREQYPHADITINQPEGVKTTTIQQFPKVLNELLTNAVIHSDQETPSVEIGVTVDNSYVEISIADDGPGIPEMERNLLTDQADMDPLYHGRGLGLWVVYLIVQQSGGTLLFEKNQPRGSVVTLRLPRASE